MVCFDCNAFTAQAGGRSGARPGGILAQWLPYGDRAVQLSVARSLQVSFIYVRTFKPVEQSGWHFLASMEPITKRSADDLVARVPAQAVADMMAWGPAATPADQFNRMLQTDMTTQKLISPSPSTPALDDDRPVNEYYMLRSWSHLMRSGVQKWTPSEFGAVAQPEASNRTAEEKKDQYVPAAVKR